MGMGWVLMSERELNRVEVLSQVSQGRMTTTNAANVLGNESQAGSSASEEVSDRWTGGDPTQGARPRFEQSDRSGGAGVRGDVGPGRTTATSGRPLLPRSLRKITG